MRAAIHREDPARGGYDATGARTAGQRDLQEGPTEGPTEGLQRPRAVGEPLAGAVDAPRGALWAALPGASIARVWAGRAASGCH